MSTRQEKQVTFRDQLERSRGSSTSSEGPPVRVPRSRSSLKQKPLVSSRSSLSASESSSRSRASSLTTRSRSSTISDSCMASTSTSLPSTTRKSLVRHCETHHTQNVYVTKPCKPMSREQEAKLVSQDNACSRISAPRVPSQHSSLKTASKIQDLKEMKFEEALERLRLEENKAKQRASTNRALNLPRDQRIFSDLVCIDVPEDHLRSAPPSGHSRSRRSQESTPPQPQLQDYCRPEPQETDLWPSFPPIYTSLEPIDMYDGRSVVINVLKWQQGYE